MLISSSFNVTLETSTCFNCGCTNQVRAIVEGQLLAMKSHAGNFGMPAPYRIIATGGASANHHLLRVVGDVFGVNVFVAERPGKPCLISTRPHFMINIPSETHFRLTYNQSPTKIG